MPAVPTEQTGRMDIHRMGENTLATRLTRTHREGGRPEGIAFG